VAHFLDDLVEELLLAAEFLSALLVVPDPGMLQFAADFR